MTTVYHRLASKSIVFATKFHIFLIFVKYAQTIAFVMWLLHNGVKLPQQIGIFYIIYTYTHEHLKEART